jgi:hypothetical protein
MVNAQLRRFESGASHQFSHPLDAPPAQSVKVRRAFYLYAPLSALIGRNFKGTQNESKIHPQAIGKYIVV